MAENRSYIAVDLGAESGRIMLGTVSSKKLELQEIYRFPNGPVEEDGSLRWDFDNLLSEVKLGIGKAIREGDHEISGIGIDSWGVDFGVLDESGLLVEDPYHYRDHRTDRMMDKAFELISKREIYEETGLQFMQFNTIYQLLAMRLGNSKALAHAGKLLFMADLVAYHLCGRVFAEYTLASTSQLMDMRTGRWSAEIFERLGLPFNIMPEVVRPGTIVGELKERICDELGCSRVKIIAAASHDTACAVAAVPAGKHEAQGAGRKRWAYLSSGTWSLMGLEANRAIINDKSFAHGFTNEGGVDNAIRFLKNIAGLWLLQECRRQWQQEGHTLDYEQLEAMAGKARSFAAHVDPDRGEFLSPGDMPQKINRYLEQTGQEPLHDKGLIARVILESLALKYRYVMEAIEDITNESIDALHIVGGGIRNELLCRFAANATGKTVVAGPVEATATGNILVQAIACGQIGSLAQGREIVGNSFAMKVYQPCETHVWSKQYDKVKKHLEAETK